MSKNDKYIIGNNYNLVILKELYRHKFNNRLMANVECKICGRVKDMRASDLYNSKANSCTCQIIKHNMENTRIYKIFHNMKYRCYNKNSDAYKNYGEKGVQVCNEWLEDFINFYNWSIKNGYKDNLTIDRIDSNKGYSPENCRWITKSKNTSYANKSTARRKANKGVYFGISPDNEYYEFDNANEFSRTHNLNAGCVRACANGDKKSYKKWKFGFINDKQ